MSCKSVKLQDGFAISASLFPA